MVKEITSAVIDYSSKKVLGGAANILLFKKILFKTCPTFRPAYQFLSRII